MQISLIAAISSNNIIGGKNTLLWRLPADMNYFKDVTLGHHVLMGRKTYESIPEKFRPLKGRTNLIITRNKDYEAAGCHIFSSISKAIHFAEDQKETELFVIGGGSIYQSTIENALKLYITEVHQEFQGDTYFPELNHSTWIEVKRENHEADSKNPYDYSFVVYQRKGLTKYL